MIELKNKKVLVTGANSMVGRSVIKSLYNRGAEVDPVYHKECDLLEYQNIEERISASRPEYCIHIAGYNGNIKFNRDYPSDIFYNTTVMGLNTLKACAQFGVQKVVSPLASCAYRSTDEQLEEKDFHIGMPSPSVEAHGLSKKALFYYSRQIYKQYGTLAVCTIFNTAYGPYDSYDINKTKVAGGLIKKFVDAAEKEAEEVVCWGTGSPRRELIYCDDAAEGVVQTLEKYDNVEWPINIGLNQDICIKELAELIARFASFDGKIQWDKTRPDGQYRKILNSARMKEYGIHIENPTSLEDGLKKTISWYKKGKKEGLVA